MEGRRSRLPTGFGDFGLRRQRLHQEEVDALVAEAVSSAVDDARDDFVSEAEAEAQAGAAAKQAALVVAVEECELVNSPCVTVDEADMVMEGERDESPGADVTGIASVLFALDVPDSLISRIDSTYLQMGVVEGRWDVYEAEWTYHPDNGQSCWPSALRRRLSTGRWSCSRRRGEVGPSEVLGRSLSEG